MDEPVDLPDDTENEVVALRVDDADDLDEEDRERLHQELALSIAEAERGETIPATEVLGELRALSNT